MKPNFDINNLYRQLKEEQNALKGGPGEGDKPVALSDPEPKDETPKTRGLKEYQDFVKTKQAYHGIDKLTLTVDKTTGFYTDVGVKVDPKLTYQNGVLPTNSITISGADAFALGIKNSRTNTLTVVINNTDTYKEVKEFLKQIREFRDECERKDVFDNIKEELLNQYNIHGPSKDGTPYVIENDNKIDVKGEPHYLKVAHLLCDRSGALFMGKTDENGKPTNLTLDNTKELYVCRVIYDPKLAQKNGIEKAILDRKYFDDHVTNLPETDKQLEIDLPPAEKGYKFKNIAPKIETSSTENLNKDSLNSAEAISTPNRDYCGTAAINDKLAKEMRDEQKLARWMPKFENSNGNNGQSGPDFS